MKQIYFDNAATTNIREEVISRMSEIMKNNFGNASSSHSFGRSSKSIIEESRKNIASHFKVSPGEIVFTAGGTEADNLVLRSAARDLGITNFITSKIEHHAVLHTLEQLKTEYDISVNYVKLTESGEIDYDDLTLLLEKSSSTLVSLMHVNNEIGNLLDISRVAKLCEQFGALLHSDSVQSVGHYRIDLSEIPIHFMAASAHKFHGPKGVGFAFIRKNSGLKPLIFGGEQERGFRAGTESVHNIVGLETSLNIAYTNLDAETEYIKSLKKHFIAGLKNTVPSIKFNGNCDDMSNSTYTVVNVRFDMPIEKAAMFQFQLDLKGIACSKGSACQSGSSAGSHVLAELLSPKEMEKPSIRFSFSTYNTIEEVDYVIATLKDLAI